MERFAVEEIAAKKAANKTPESKEATVSNDRFHTVKPGESLSRIAKQHGTTPEILAGLNKIKNPAMIQVGQKLALPAIEPPKATPIKTETTKSEKANDSNVQDVE